MRVRRPHSGEASTFLLFRSSGQDPSFVHRSDAVCLCFVQGVWLGWDVGLLLERLPEIPHVLRLWAGSPVDVLQIWRRRVVPHRLGWHNVEALEASSGAR